MREFWLDIEKGQTYFSKVNGAVHVIEYKEYEQLRSKLEKTIQALVKIKDHDGHRHSEDPDDTAWACLKEIGEAK